MIKMKTSAALLMVTALLAGYAVPAAAATSWSIVKSPNVAIAGNVLSGVACASASNCWAVGNSIQGAGAAAFDQTVAEHYNGTAWTVVKSPDTSAFLTNALSAVTCPSSSSCWAVGTASNGAQTTTLVEQYNGTSWRIVSSPNPSTSQMAELRSVTCISTTNCLAVGDWYDGTATLTLTEHYDGTSWTIVPPPTSLIGSAVNILKAVSCVSATDCWAAGDDFVNSVSLYETLIEQYNGTSWTIVSSPNAGSSQFNFLNGITCVSASECWATGFYNASGGSQTLIERYNGASWSIVASPNTNTSQDNILDAVTCPSSSNCWAVGHSYDGTADQSLAAQYNGTSWRIVASPDTSTSKNNDLHGVACTSTTGCWTVGNANTASPGFGGVDRTRALRYNGTAWAAVSTPNEIPAQTNVLNAVACASSTACWAVGYRDDALGQTLIEHYNGTSWKAVSSPNVTPAGQEADNELTGATCTSSTNCWAVGWYVDGSDGHTVIEHYTGTSWSIIASPSPDTSDYLYGVSCIGATACWAVGQGYNGSSYVTLVEHYDGTAWAVVASPTPGTGGSLNGVTCSAAIGCFATGYYSTTTAFLTLIERCSATCAVIASPSPAGSLKSVLASVSCVSGSACWATGEYFTSVASQTLIEQYNGTAWSIVSSPNKSTTQDDDLGSVACTSTSSCSAVGSYASGSVSQTLVEQFNGTSWMIVSSPNKGSTLDESLNGVACTSTTNCWAVGTYASASLGRTLVEQGP